MRLRGWVGVGVLLLLGAGATPAAAVTFGAAVIGPVSGSPFVAVGVIGVAPIPRAWALTLTRAVDATSPRLAVARTAGTHLRSVRLAWSAAGQVQSVCLDDVAVTSYTRRAVPGGGVTVEHLTLYYAAITRAAGLDACRRRTPPRPVVVRLQTDPVGALHARVDCLLARCAGVLRLLCPSEGCPSGGLRVGPFALGPGQERILPVALGHSVRARHPKLTAAVTLDGAAAPIVAPVVVDPPPPPPLASLLAAAPSSSGASTPAAPPGSAPAGAS
ncbi:MAG: type VI secretion system tube protein Hcp, partial [Solirubrobacteraceae bacterium]